MSDTQKADVVKDEETQGVTKPGKDSPQFGRLLLVLVSAVALIVVITFATEAYYTP